MKELYNIYCDESCHLEHDGINVMVLGAVWCPQDKLKEINNRIKDIKEKHGVSSTSELKWTKVGPKKETLYTELVNYFFDNQNLHFRCLVVPEKGELDHNRYNQSHDDWYYKMYFDMLKVIFNPDDIYEVYVDIKDSNSSTKSRKLREVCRNDIYDFSGKVIKRIQPIRSHEVQIMQLVDVLIGAVAYENRRFPNGFIGSKTKKKLIDLIKTRSKYKLTKTTLLREDKVNIFVWRPR